MRKMLAPLLALVLGATAAGAEERELTVKVTVPDAGWTVVIDSVHLVGEELWVVASLARDPQIMAAQMISTVTASVKVEAADLPVKRFVVGKTWGWENDDECVFIKDVGQIGAAQRSGRLLYQRTAKR